MPIGSLYPFFPVKVAILLSGVAARRMAYVLVKKWAICCGWRWRRRPPSASSCFMKRCTLRLPTCAAASPSPATRVSRPQAEPGAPAGAVLPGRTWTSSSSLRGRSVTVDRGGVMGRMTGKLAQVTPYDAPG